MSQIKKRFRQDKKEFERRYEGQYTESMMGATLGG